MLKASSHYQMNWTAKATATKRNCTWSHLCHFQHSHEDGFNIFDVRELLPQSRSEQSTLLYQLNNQKRGKANHSSTPVEHLSRLGKGSQLLISVVVCERVEGGEDEHQPSYGDEE